MFIKLTCWYAWAITDTSRLKLWPIQLFELISLWSSLIVTLPTFPFWVDLLMQVPCFTTHPSNWSSPLQGSKGALQDAKETSMTVLNRAQGVVTEVEAAIERKPRWAGMVVRCMSWIWTLWLWVTNTYWLEELRIRIWFVGVFQGVPRSFEWSFIGLKIRWHLGTQVGNSGCLFQPKPNFPCSQESVFLKGLMCWEWTASTPLIFEGELNGKTISEVSARNLPSNCHV